MNKVIRVSREIDGNEWAVDCVCEDGIYSLCYSKTVTIDEPVPIQELEDDLLMFAARQSTVTVCKRGINEDELHKQLLERLLEQIINSKSKIRTSNFQGENSLQAYLNGKAKREHEIINIINGMFCEVEK